MSKDQNRNRPDYRPGSMIGVGIPVVTGFGIALGAAIDIRKRTGQWQDASQNQRIILIISIVIVLALLAVGLGLLVFNML